MIKLYMLQEEATVYRMPIHKAIASDINYFS